MSTFVLAPVVVAALVMAAPAAAAAPAPTPESSSSIVSRRVFVVPSGDDGVDGAVRAGVGGDGVVLVDVEATTAVLSDARAVGIVCGAGDGACWWRLAELGGFDVVVFVAGDVVTVQTASSTKTATTAGRGSVAFSSATRRALGVAGEVRVHPKPAAAVVLVDDVEVVVQAGVAIASVPAGTHRVVVRAPGFVDSASAVGVGAGAVVDVPVELAALSSSSAPSSSAWLRDGGIGVLTLTVAVAGGLVAWGQVPYLACYGDGKPAGCAADGAITKTANETAWAAMVVGAVGGLVGGGAFIAGGMVEPGG